MKIYFASDFHLGIPDHASSLRREKLLAKWLDEIKADATEIFLMGDVFDFWFEYKTVVPRGFTRFFGKLAELTDQGIPIHLFRGNHDIWAFDYFAQEIGVELEREFRIREWNGKKFFLSHGDGLGPGDHGYKLLKRVFEFKPNQWLFRWLHPDIGTRLALYFSRRSRYANEARDAYAEQHSGIDLTKERLFTFAQKTLEEQPDINYFIFGHRHVPADIKLNETSRFINLGDWITNFSYAVFDGNDLTMMTYRNGCAEPIKETVTNTLK
ncbi:MAG: UDP-2,3-diacylglucosamine diphosphatase [Lentimicrobiaceae bacterium]|nr:UDP-2,3-diacylglucosamine diphosphatase [Lentimicrobiaceae bacterium]